MICMKKKIKVEDIIIPGIFAGSTPKPTKLIEKTAEYLESGKIASVYVDRNKVLVDGYCSYLILKTLGVKKIKCVQIKEKDR